MIRFLRLWLVPILALMMLAGIALAFVPLTQRAQQRAETELTQLTDRAFARIEGEELETDPVIEAQKESLISKAKAVARFLAHDDTLLESDALLALCEQLSADRIDVADAQGTLIASSDDSRVGLTLGTQEAFAWTMDAAADTTAALAQADEATPEVLYACVGRQDIDGFVLLSKNDSFAAVAEGNADAETVVSDLPSGEDMLFPSEMEGTDGFFREAGNLCLRRTQNGVTLIAARPLSAVFAVRNAVLLAFAVSFVCVAICALVDYLLRLEPVVTVDEDPALNAGEEPAGLLAEESAIKELEAAKPRGRRRRPKAEAEEEMTIELPENAGQAEDRTAGEQEQGESEDEPQRDRRIPKRKHHAVHGEPEEEISEDGFDKIVE